MAPPDNHELFETNMKETLELMQEKFKEENPKLTSRTSRSQPTTMDEYFNKVAPLFIGCIIKSVTMLRQDNGDKLKTDISSIKKHLIEQRLHLDRMETNNRQDNIILIGHDEPPKNYSAHSGHTLWFRWK